jgi:hypothetical protein
VHLRARFGLRNAPAFYSAHYSVFVAYVHENTGARGQSALWVRLYLHLYKVEAPLLGIAGPSPPVLRLAGVESFWVPGRITPVTTKLFEYNFKLAVRSVQLAMGRHSDALAVWHKRVCSGSI